VRIAAVILVERCIAIGLVNLPAERFGLASADDDGCAAGEACCGKTGA
jgi:hypothetical protein